MSNSLWHNGLQPRTPCPSLPPKDYSNSCPLSQRCHLAISASVTSFSPCLQSFSASRSFPMSRVFPLDGQSTGASALASVLPMNIQGWFPLGLTGPISLLFKGLPRIFPAPQFKRINPSALCLLYGPTLTSIHDYHSFDSCLPMFNDHGCPYSINHSANPGDVCCNLALKIFPGFNHKTEEQ